VAFKQVTAVGNWSPRRSAIIAHSMCVCVNLNVSLCDFYMYHCNGSVQKFLPIKTRRLFNVALARKEPFALPGVVRQKRWRATRTPSSVGSTRPWRACPAVHWAAQPAASTGRHSSRPRPAAGIRSDSMPSPFAGLKVPQGNDRRELYKSQYRAIYTCTCSLAPDCQRPPTQPSPRGSTEVDRGGWDVFRVSLSQDVRS